MPLARICTLLFISARLLKWIKAAIAVWLRLARQLILWIIFKGLIVIKIVRHNIITTILILAFSANAVYFPIVVSAQSNLPNPAINSANVNELINIDKVKSVLPTVFQDFISKLQGISDKGIQSLWQSFKSHNLIDSSSWEGWLKKIGSYLEQLNQKIKSAFGLDLILILKKIGSIIVWFFEKIIQVLKSLIS